VIQIYGFLLYVLKSLISGNVRWLKFMDFCSKMPKLRKQVFETAVSRLAGALLKRFRFSMKQVNRTCLEDAKHSRACAVQRELEAL